MNDGPSTGHPKATTLIKIPFLRLSLSTIPFPGCVISLYKYANIYYTWSEGHQQGVNTAAAEEYFTII